MKFPSLSEIIRNKSSFKNETEPVVQEHSLKELISDSESDYHDTFSLDEYDSNHDIQMESISMTPPDDETSSLVTSVGSDWVLLD
jgi:hypothetical protein